MGLHADMRDHKGAFEIFPPRTQVRSAQCAVRANGLRPDIHVQNQAERGYRVFANVERCVHLKFLFQCTAVAVVN